jgi:hypothetical protein
VHDCLCKCLIYIHHGREVGAHLASVLHVCLDLHRSSVGEDKKIFSHVWYHALGSSQQRRHIRLPIYSLPTCSFQFLFSASPSALALAR